MSYHCRVANVRFQKQNNKLTICELNEISFRNLDGFTSYTSLKDASHILLKAHFIVS